jgi:CRP/FNR family transcriptional regulator
MNIHDLDHIRFKSEELKNEIHAVSEIIEIEADSEILRVGQFVKVIPIVLIGAIKVFTQSEDRDLLLYYIEPNESCIMSFTAGINDEPSKIYAIAETDTVAMLIPIDEVRKLIKKYPEFNSIFFEQYNLRYTDLLDTINQIIFTKLDDRLIEYLKKKIELSGSNEVEISHREIAHDLGTAREVVSRIIKKLEKENKLEQNNHVIKLSAL